MKQTGRNQRKSYFEMQQPFDLFEDLKEPTASPVYRQYPIKRPKSVRIWAAMGFVVLVAIGAWFLASMQKADSRPPFVFLELRAVSPKGNPLAGAKVEIAGKELGVTDSFGEWRRYLRLRPGTRLPVRLSREHQGHLFLAEHVLTVPAPREDGREAELKSSLALKLVEQKQTHDLSEQNRGDRAQQSQGFRVPSSYLSQNHLLAIDIRHVQFKSQYGGLMENHQAEVLRNRVLPELIAQVEDFGIPMDRNAGWKFLLSYVPEQGQVGMIRGELVWRDQRERPQRSMFVTEFSKTVEETARSLVRLAKSHVNKHYGASFHQGAWYVDSPGETSTWALTEQVRLKDPNGELLGVVSARDSQNRPVWRLVGGQGIRPCQGVVQSGECVLSSPSFRDVAPRTGWALQQMRVEGSLPEDGEIYVTGYRAYPLRGHIWSYWGDPHSEPMVTVVKDHRLVFRGRLRREGDSNPPLLRLPGRTTQAGQRQDGESYQ